MGVVVKNVELSPLLELGNNGSVRNLVINFLGQEWPLNVRKLYSKIEQFKPGISYHAVHKAVQQMVAQGMLKRDKDGYLLDSEWLEQAHATIDKMMSACQPDSALRLPALKDFKEGESRTFVFRTLADADSYRKRLHKEYVEDVNASKPFVGMARHMKSPLFYTEKSFAEASLAKRIKTFFLISGKTALDEWCADFYRAEGQRVKTGIECAKTCDITVLGDTIIQVYLDDKTAKLIDSVYAGARKVSEINVPELFNRIYLSNSEIKIVVTRNSGMAEQLQNKVIGQFKSDSVAIFDIAGVFVEPDYPIWAMRWLSEKGLFDPKAGKVMLDFCTAYENKEITRDEFVLKYIENYARAVKGKRATDIEAALREFVMHSEFDIVYRFSTRLFGLMRSYRKMIAMARWPSEFARALSDVFEFDDIIASELEVVDGKYTGRVVQSMGTPDEKEAAFKKWLESNSMPKCSIGLGDRAHDAAFLKHVEFPIAVNPDPQLLAIAKKRGWFIGKSDSELLLNRLRAILRGEACDHA